MTADTWALIDSDDQVINIIVWDGLEELVIPDGLKIIKCDDKPFCIGCKYKNGEVVSPEIA
ncbi:hypothetical protein [Klebsiella quasipneumoniae]|uniref:hypothetical protein n=1 Tax=Klebsiella quasipneumoniae TaxID=1463165 RepID=UPI001CD6BE80|nr:hypothetical protein [Klebsiella quasipneumoniae]